MARPFALALLLALSSALVLTAQEDFRQGKIKKADPKRSILTITVDGKDHDYAVSPKTRFRKPKQKAAVLDLSDPDVRPGAAVQFHAAVWDGRETLMKVRLTGASDEPRGSRKVDTTGLVPLTELGPIKYKGFSGGLYPGGQNQRPPPHEAAGLALARQVQPLDRTGRPAPDGKIAMISVCVSNMAKVFTAFKRMADGDSKKSRRVLIVKAPPGHSAIVRILDPVEGSAYWKAVEQSIRDAGGTQAQVQVAWIQQADVRPTGTFPEHAKSFQAELVRLVQTLHDRFPNLKLVYLSSQTYAGFARSGFSPEPYAYESAFAVRWLIDQQLAGEPALNYDPARGKVRAPWLGWGPYLWANGTTKRVDGFAVNRNDFRPDGLHLSPSGQQAMARVLLRFFSTDTTTRPWFIGR